MESVVEVWGDVKGYEGRYRVSNLGRVQSRTRATGWQWQDKATHVNKETGYSVFSACSNSKKVTRYVHRCVAEAFCEPREGATCVDHVNNDKTDNRAQNLEWVTYEENNRRFTSKFYKRGSKAGENGPKNKVPELSVLEALESYARGEAPGSVCRRLGVDSSWLHAVLSGKSWSHLNIDGKEYRRRHALSKQRAGNLRK